MSSEITSTNPVVKAIIEGSAPRPAQLAASRGILPLAEIDLFEVLVAFYNSDDEELKDNARQTLATQDTEMLRETLLSANIAPPVLAYFVDQPFLPYAVYETIIANPQTPGQRDREFRPQYDQRRTSRTHLAQSAAADQ